MKKINLKLIVSISILVCLISFLPKQEAKAAKELFTVTANDGYTKQKIKFYYGKTIWEIGRAHV